LLPIIRLSFLFGYYGIGGEKPEELSIEVTKYKNFSLKNDFPPNPRPFGKLKNYSYINTYIQKLNYNICLMK